MSNKPKTLYDKIWESHLVREHEDGSALLFIDRHLIHEVTSAQAFEGLRLAGRKMARPDLALAVPDHNVPTDARRHKKIADPLSALQLKTLKKNCKSFDIPYFDIQDKRQGIVHVIGPEQGFTLPGLTLVCGDSHTATHGAFGCLAFGIGTTEIEHVMATQTLLTRKMKNMRIKMEGDLAPGVTGKDLILYVIGQIGIGGGTSHVMEFTGSSFKSLSMEGRMSVCNMAIEAGARAGLMAPDQTVFDYLNGRPMAPKDAWNTAETYWRSLQGDLGADYDKNIVLHAKHVAPQVTWGTNPEEVIPVHEKIPNPNAQPDAQKREAWHRALEYMGLEAGQPIKGIKIDRVFIGSCTNSRIEDIRQAAKLAKGKKVAQHVGAMVVPGSGLVKAQAEKEGLDRILTEAGFEWREPGCSMCLGMNPDQLAPYERCASTSNRNFEGRQGRFGRTHLMSPSMATAAAITGQITDIRDFI